MQNSVYCTPSPNMISTHAKKSSHWALAIDEDLKLAEARRLCLEFPSLTIRDGSRKGQQTPVAEWQ